MSRDNIWRASLDHYLTTEPPERYPDTEPEPVEFIDEGREVACADCMRVLHGAERDTHSCPAQRRRNRRAARKGKA